MREAWMQWSITKRCGAIPTDPAFAIDVTKRVGANAVLLISHDVDLPLGVDYFRRYADVYHNAGFNVYVSVAQETMLTPNQINFLLTIQNLKGLAANLFGSYTKQEAENGLLTLLQACKNTGKEFIYYHGDALGMVDATVMSQAGCIVWAWWTGAWKPGTWEISPICAQECIFNRIENGVLRYTTPDEIKGFYESLPRIPEMIGWWQTTCGHNPTEEQIEAMREVTGMFLGAPPILPELDIPLIGGIALGIVDATLLAYLVASHIFRERVKIG